MVQIVRRTGPKKPKFDWTVPIEPVPYVPKPITKRILIFDSETDPFLYGRIVRPFTCGLYDTETGDYWDFWGADCIDQMFAHIRAHYTFNDIECLILCHNFGNFDAYFCLDYLDSGTKPFLINGRIVRAIFDGQEFRDTYAIMPFALSEFQKDDIDYRCLYEGFRDVYRDEILAYQKSDCINLANAVLPWYEIFGDKLTIASASLGLLRSYQGFETVSEKVDEDMRPYYFGGRNQCFATGVIEGEFYVYDINSSYPNSMRNFMHPISDTPHYETKITNRTHFAHIRAWSLGALPIRNKDGSLSFPIGTFDFYACIHEIRAGLETKTLRIIKVYSSIYFDKEANFAEFVDDMFGRRLEATERGDKAKRMHYKYALNSPYGKFAQDPRKYENWLFDPDSVPTPEYCATCHGAIMRKEKRDDCETCSNGATSPYGWFLHTTRDGRNIFAAPQRVRGSSFFNVSTAASITSASRATLLRGLQAATRPLYCDTDSIICEAIDTNVVDLHPSRLGAWDTEASGDTVCIAGKKLYAIYNKGEPIKKASKGVKLSADEIRRVCEGDTIEYANPVPKFSLTRDTVFVTRKISATT
jgi:hypothetical protein